MTPVKTIERLLMYRTILEQNLAQGVTQIHSKDLADQSGNNSAQVRRDLMTVGYLGNPQKGYVIKDLLHQISILFEPEGGITIALIGVGNLGRAIITNFNGYGNKFKLIAAFDVDEYKVNRVIAGCRCYHVKDIEEVLKPYNVLLGVITVPSNQAQDAADLLVHSGVKGIFNFAALPVKVPGNIYVENVDISKTFEKVAYFARFQNIGGTNG